MRRIARTDANQQDVIDAMRKLGASVQPLHRVGQGCPDLLVGYRQQNLLMEVKDGSKPPSDRRLTPDQSRWLRDWKGPVFIVTSPLEAVGFLQNLRP